MTDTNFVKWGKKIDSFPLRRTSWSSKQKEIWGDVTFYLDNLSGERLKSIALNYQKEGALRWNWLQNYDRDIFYKVIKWVEDHRKNSTRSVSMSRIPNLRYIRNIKTFVVRQSSFLTSLNIRGGYSQSDWPKSFILTHKSGKQMKFLLRSYGIKKTKGIEGETPAKFTIYESESGRIYFVVTMLLGTYKMYGKVKSSRYGGYGSQTISAVQLDWEDYQ